MPRVHQSRVIVVFGTKGGVGKTVIAANLAASLVKDVQKKVALLDLDLYFGKDVATILNITKGRTIAEIRPFIDRIDPNLLKGYLTKHSSGVDVLSAISEPKQAKLVSPESIEKIITSLKQFYDYIVVDTKGTFSKPLIAAFDNADLVLLVTTPDYQSINHTKWALEVMFSLHFPYSLTKIVVNRMDSQGATQIEEIEADLQQKVLCQIPEDNGTILSSINRGIPFISDLPQISISKSIRELAYYISGAGRGEIFTAGRRKERIFREELGPEELSLEAEGEYLEEDLSKMPQEDIEIARRQREIIDLKTRVHKKLIERMDLKKMDLEVGKDPKKMRELRFKTEKVIEEILAGEGAAVATRRERERLITEILDEALGLGPLEDLLRDPEITEIMVNRYDQIYIEKHGKIEISEKRFIDNGHVLSVIERIVAPIGRRIDESTPYVDARLKDGSRVHAIIPPLALQGPTLTIRKFSKDTLTVKDLINFGSLGPEIADFLRVCVQVKKNIVISGGTGSGKTTLLNIISSYIPHNERIVTIEDSAELRLPQEHVVSLEARRPNIEGKGEVAIRDLVRNALRMRPDRIVVGECRGGEALDMLQAMNTGHEGSLTTAHANSQRDLLSRLETMALMAEMELPSRAIREQISAAIDVIVQISRLSDGSRKIIGITEVTGMEGTTITLQDIFLFKQTALSPEGKVEGYFEPTGIVPTFFEGLEARGIKFSYDIFQKKKGKEKVKA